MIKLWTIMQEKAFRSLEANETLRCGPDHLDLEYYNPGTIEWIIGQMNKRIGPAPHGVAGPIWAYKQWAGSSNMKPDLRSIRHYWAPSGPHYRVEYELSEDKMLLSDMDIWACILNGAYSAETKEESDDFDLRLKASGHKENWPYPEPFLKEVTDSWELAFRLDIIHEDYYTTIGRQTIQATVWEIPLSTVIDVTPFTSLAFNQDLK